MGRTHPKCAIYMLINTKTNKRYIGETSNIVDRLSYYKNAKQRVDKCIENSVRPIDQAIADYGFNAFRFIMLEHEDINSDITNLQLRRILESYYINKYNTTDPEFGYNIRKDVHIPCNKYNERVYNVKKKGTPCSDETKLLKSNPIFVYDIDTREVSYHSGCKTFGDLIGKDKAIIARCVHNGKKTSHYYILSADPELRHKNAINIIQNKQNVIDQGADFNGKASKSLNKYIEALIMINEFCKAHSEYEEIDLSFIHQRTRYFHLTKL